MSEILRNDKSVSAILSEQQTEATAERIRDKAYRVGADGDHAESRRLLLLAECIWPSDPAQRVVDRLEREQVIARLQPPNPSPR